MNTKKIINDLDQHKEEVIEKLLAHKGEHFVRYFWIKERFLKNKIDDEFKENFCFFYVMNGARGLNGSQKDVFFKLLASRQKSLANILKLLYEVPGYGNRHKLFLSFGTKLLHTVNDNLPIYDGNIAHVLELARQSYPASHEARVQNRKDIYGELKNDFDTLLATTEIKKYLKNARKEFCSRAKQVGFCWQDDSISDTKLLDSFLWALSTILKNQSQ